MKVHVVFHRKCFERDAEVKAEDDSFKYDRGDDAVEGLENNDELSKVQRGILAEFLDYGVKIIISKDGTITGEIA